MEKDSSLAMHLLNRKRMFWKVRLLNASTSIKIANGEKWCNLIPLMRLEYVHIINIRNMIIKVKRGTWHGFSQDAWIQALNTELRYRDYQINEGVIKPLLNEFENHPNVENYQEGIKNVQLLLMQI